MPFCFFLSLLTLLTLALPCTAADRMECRFDKPSIQSRGLDGFHISLLRVLETGADDRECQAAVITSEGKTIFAATSWMIAVHEATGSDINGDGQPEVVFEGYSGGAHCCWTYWIVSLENPPGLVAEIHNKAVLRFRDIDSDGRLEIEGADGAFDYFDGLCHACSPFPRVVLDLQGDNLADMTKALWTPENEKSLRDLRQAITQNDLREFMKADPALTSGTNTATKQRILELVLAYLYSGRGQDAWKVLDEMWPPSDKERIKGLILETRKCGILNYVYKTCAERDDGLYPHEKP